MYDTSQVYMPAEDTFLLRDVACAEVTSDDIVLEMGTGSGEVAAALMKIAARTLACDINPHAVAYAHEVHGLDVIQSNLFSAISGTFSLILFNAPYLPTNPEERMNDWLEYALDGGIDGRKSIAPFLSQARDHLTENGRILLLISSLTGLEEVMDLVTDIGYSAEIIASEQEEDGEYLYVLKIVKNN